MKAKQIMKIFKDTAYVRMGGSTEERKAAQYIADLISDMGLTAEIVPFEVPMATLQEATLTVDGKAVICKGYLNAGNHEVEAPFYYLRATDPFSLSQCKGKIVMVDGYLGYWLYQDLLESKYKHLAELGFVVNAVNQIHKESSIISKICLVDYTAFLSQKQGKI